MSSVSSMFVPTSAETKIGTWALHLVTVGGEKVHSMGTAVLIAQTLALTARHILDACEKAYGWSADGHGDFLMVALQYGPQPRPVAFAVERIFALRGGDLALLHLNGSQRDFPRAFPRLSFRLPRAGDHVQAFGYPGHVAVHGDAVDVDPTPRTSIGEVIEVFPAGRDRVIAPHPCFRTNARFDDSMSGGPVFIAGKLCGLVCSSMPATPEHPDHDSLVSLLWPIAGLEVDLPWRNRPSTRRTFKLVEFLKAGAPGSVDGLELVQEVGDTVHFQLGGGTGVPGR